MTLGTEVSASSYLNPWTHMAGRALQCMGVAAYGGSYVVQAREKPVTNSDAAVIVNSGYSYTIVFYTLLKLV